MADPQVKVVVVGDTRGFERDMAKVAKVSENVSQNVVSVGKGAAAALAGIGIGRLAGEVIGAASDFTEALNKSNSVFGSSGMAIENWAKGAADNIGLSATAALNAAGSFGNMFSQLGIGSQQAAKMSEDIVGLAADFASFHNADISQVLDAQSAAFRGEYDALQRFLPTMSAATIEQRALEMTGKKTTASLTAQDKALAVNALMHEGAGAAAGDFARTSGSLANQQRILKAEMENFSASIGSAVVPALSGLIGFINNKVIPVFEDFFNPKKGDPKGWASRTKDAVDDVLGFAAQGVAGLLDIAGATTPFPELVNNFENWSGSLKDWADIAHLSAAEVQAHATSAINDTAASRLAMGAALDASGAFKSLGEATGMSTKEMEDHTKAVVAEKDAAITLRDAHTAVEDAIRDENEARDTLNKLLETGGVDMEKVHDAQQTMIDSQNDLDTALRSVTEAQEALNKAMEPASPKDLAKGQRGLEAAQDDVTTAGLRLTDAQTDLNTLYASGTATASELTEAEIRVRDAQRDLADAEDRVIEKQGDLNELQKTGSGESATYQTASENLTIAQNAAETATAAFSTAQGALNAAQGVAPGFAKELEEANRTLAEKTLAVGDRTWDAEKATTAYKTALQNLDGPLKTATTSAAGYADALNNIPAVIETAVKLGLDPASVQGLIHDTGNIMSGLTLSPMQVAPPPSLGAGALAGAGLGLAGAAAINVTINGALDPNAVGSQIVSILRTWQQKNGPAGLS